MRGTTVNLPDGTFGATESALLSGTVRTSQNDNATSNRAAAVLAPVVNVCSSTVFVLISAALALIIPVLQLVVGWQYSEQCPINRKIPLYLWVAGIGGIASFLITQLRNYLVGKNNKAENEPSNAGGINKWAMSLLTLLSSLLALFLLVWFIFGCIWIFSVWKEVRYDAPEDPLYCRALVYRVAYIVSLISIVMIACCCCCLPLLTCVVGGAALTFIRPGSRR